ncbi:hypothetical protein MTO96_036392 [Rhipicephalus appendiculatus]
MPALSPVNPPGMESSARPVHLKVSPLEDKAREEDHIQGGIYDDRQGTEGNLASAITEATRKRSREAVSLKTLSGAIGVASKASALAQDAVQGIQRWARFRHPPAAITEGKAPPPSTKLDGRTRCTARVSLLAAAGAVATTLVAIFLMRRRSDTTTDEIEVCSTLDCVDHARILGLGRTQATDHCDNFGQFVCSGWTLKNRRLTLTIPTELTLDWMQALVRTSLRVDSSSSSVLDRPLNMLHRCVDDAGNEDLAMEEFVNFVDGRTFAWPTEEWSDAEVIPTSRALMALVELAAVWALPLWFRVDFYPSFLVRPESVVAITASMFPRLYVQVQEEIMQYEDVYPLYARGFIDVILSRRPAARAFEEFIKASATMQSHVLGNLSSAIEARFAPMVFTFEVLGKTVNNLSAEDWQLALRNVSPTLLTNDAIVFTSNERILAAMNIIFGAYSARDIWFHIAWWFVQAVGIVVSETVSAVLSIHPLGQFFRNAMCLVHVDGPYGALIAAGQRTIVAPAEQLKIRQLVEHVREVAVEKIRFSTMLGASTRSAIADLISKTKTIIWPERGFDSLGAMERIYGPSRNRTSTFFGEWLRSREQWQRARNHAANTDISSVFLADLKYIALYNAATNTISLSPAVLGPPLFYAHGTSAMLYGGLGYVYAAEVVRAVNVLSYLLNDFYCSRTYGYYEQACFLERLVVFKTGRSILPLSGPSSARRRLHCVHAF